jgi:hypothetical protein
VVYVASHRAGQLAEGDPEGWSTVLVTALGSWEKYSEGGSKERSTLLLTALSSVLGKPVPRSLLGSFIRLRYSVK